MVQNVLRKNLRKVSVASLRDSATFIATNLASPAAIRSFTSLGVLEENELLCAYVDSLRAVWWFLFGAAVCAGILCLFIQDVDLDQQDRT